MFLFPMQPSYSVRGNLFVVGVRQRGKIYLPEDLLNAAPPIIMIDFDLKTYSCLDEIHTFLNPHTKHFYKVGDDAIFVHSAIFRKFCKILSAHHIHIDEANTWDFTLCIAGQQYPNYLVWIRNESQTQMEFLFELYASSVYSFPWESVESIYQPVDRFHLVEDFIRKTNLCKYIRKMRTDKSRTFSSDYIKIVEFDETLPKDALKPFREVLDKNHINSKNVYLLTRAFNYLRPTYLNYLNVPFYNPDAITQVLLLLEYHRENMKRGREIFDLFDLIAMKLAIDDARLEYENCEFHKLIGETLRRMSRQETYIKSNAFNLVEYRSERTPWSRSKHIYQYLIYNYHEYFDCIVNHSNAKTVKIKLSKIRTDRLVAHMANCKGWLILDIDETDLNDTSADTLLTILTNTRVQKNSLIKIVWNSDFKWWYSGDHVGHSLNYELRNITFSFYGTNKYNFIENFINWLKLVLDSRCSGLNFEFYRTDIVYPFIFTNLLTNELIFRSTKLTYRLLTALERCNTNRVLISECPVQNNQNMIGCLENMARVWRIYIAHEEHTFSIISKFIEQQLKSRSEFQFDKDIRITCYNHLDNGVPNRLCLKDFKFYVNQDGTKIEAYHVVEKKLVNLYDYLYLDKFNNVNLVFEQRDDFLFYE